MYTYVTRTTDIIIFCSTLNEKNVKAFFSLRYLSFDFMLFHSGKIQTEYWTWSDNFTVPSTIPVNTPLII